MALVWAVRSCTPGQEAHARLWLCRSSLGGTTLLDRPKPGKSLFAALPCDASMHPSAALGILAIPRFFASSSIHQGSTSSRQALMWACVGPSAAASHRPVSHRHSLCFLSFLCLFEK